MKKILTFILISITTTASLAQLGTFKPEKLELQTLLHVYNCKTLTEAYNILGTYKTYYGLIYIDTKLKDTALKGRISKDSVWIKIINGKVNFKLDFVDSNYFDYYYAEAEKQLYSITHYRRSGNGISRSYFVFSDSKEMKIGDLWFILCICTDIKKKTIYYELELRPYVED